jgi:fatty-acyl-CoA synthase
MPATSPQPDDSYWAADTSEPVLETTIGDILRAAAEAAPNRTGLIYAEPGDGRRRRWRFAELLEESERAAAALLARFQYRERVAVWAPNCPEWLPLDFGTALAGLTLVPVNPALRARELLHILRQSQAAGLFLAPAFRGTPLLPILAEIKPQLPQLREVVLLTEWEHFLSSTHADVRLPCVLPDDIAQILYTSGTTGAPKGALLHHRGLTNVARFWGESLGARQGETWLNPAPLFHVAASGFLTLGALQFQSPQVLCPFEPGMVLELIESEKPAIVGAPPTMLEFLLSHPQFSRRDLSSLRVVATGGMPVSADLVRRAESQLGVSFQISYGQTEVCGCSHGVRASDSYAIKAETVGRPLPQFEVRISDPAAGSTQPFGTVGEVLVRGYQVMKGYFELPEATAAAIDSDGWLHTGDLGSMDREGNLRIAGRLKEMIIRGGENIFPTRNRGGDRIPPGRGRGGSVGSTRPGVR